MKSFTDKFGSLGNWKKVDELLDETIVKQINEASCVSAVGEMLAEFYGLNILQEDILENLGEWSNSKILAKFLNSIETRNDEEWTGSGFSHNINFIEGITAENKVWGVFLRDGQTAGHAVLINGLDENGLIIIKDPFDQSTYKIEIKELYNVLSEFVLRRKKQ